jgi:hypothetical protein
VRARRVAVTEPNPSAGAVADYADVFEIEQAATDQRSAEQWARDGFGKLPLHTQRAGMRAHRYLLGFALGPFSSPQHLFGWQVVRSQPTLFHLTAAGPRMQADMVWRLYEGHLRMTTFVHYRQPIRAALIWLVAGRIHRKAVPNLLRAAAKAAAT